MADSDSGSYCFWAEGLEREERARRAVAAQKVVCRLPMESYRRDKDLENIRLYECNPTLPLYAWAGAYYSNVAVMAMQPVDTSVNNKAKAAIDTLAAQIASTDQRARFLAVDADYRQRRRARELQHFTDGLVHELKLHRLKQRAFIDAAVLESGVGALQFYKQDGRVKCQRVLATELSVDTNDGLVSGEPRTIYRRRPAPRDWVKAIFGDKKTEVAIREARRVDGTSGAPTDTIEVFETWTLPTTKKSKDGYHIVALDIEGGALEVEEYDRPMHEIVLFSVEGRFTTGWGLSLMTQARRLQRRINQNDYRIDRAQSLFHAGHLYVPREMRLDKSKLSNEIGSVWEGNGTVPPQQIQFQCAAKELYDQIERDGQRIFENLGISVAASQGETNAGLNASAASKREDTAKSDKRNGVRQQRWEQFHLDCVRVGLAMVRELVGSGSSTYKVASPGKRGMTKVDWAQASMDEEDYVLEIRPASPLPTEPAGLIAQGSELVQNQVWKPEDLADAVQDLDVDGRVSRRLSQKRSLEKMYERLLYDKTAAAMPNKYTNLQVAIEIGTEYLAQGEEDGVPPKHLQRVQRYLDKCLSMQQKAAQPTPQAAAQGAAPPAPAPAAAAA